MAQQDNRMSWRDMPRLSIGMDFTSLRVNAILFPRMHSPDLPSDIDLLGTKTVQWMLEAWDCAILGDHRILSLGYSQARTGYSVFRQNPSFGNINVTLSGRGEAFVQNKWRTLTAGTFSISPKGVPHGARPAPGKPWEFCWICFAEPPDHPPRIVSSEIILIHSDPVPLATTTIINFYREWRDTRQKIIFGALLDLIDLYIQRIIAPWPVENRLWKLWEHVTRDPAHLWTDEEKPDFLY